MRAELKRLHSPDAVDLRQYWPQNPQKFSLLLQLMVGPIGGDGEESFDLVLCTPPWLDEQLKKQPVFVGLHHLIVDRFDYDRIFAFLQDWCSKIEGSSWQDIARQLAQIGHWEFDSYRESP
jgi:hypothetical protein